MYSNFDDLPDLFFIAASKEQRSRQSSNGFSKVIRNEAINAEEQTVDCLPKESIWSSDNNIRFDTVLAPDWKAPKSVGWNLFSVERGISASKPASGLRTVRFQSSF
jgi:hypothetical protein